MNDILVERATYADECLMEMYRAGKINSFGAHVAAFVRSHPDEAEALAEHHIKGFFDHKLANMRPQVASRPYVHNLFRQKVRRIKPNVDSDESLGHT